MTWEKDGYIINTDPARLHLDKICLWLQNSYWAADRSRELIERSIRHSIVFGLYQGEAQIGFARLVTDHATFAWLCDVVVDPDHRRDGLGKWLVECAISHPNAATALQLLRTRDAHGLYERFGFEKAEYMMRRPIKVNVDSEQ